MGGSPREGFVLEKSLGVCIGPLQAVSWFSNPALVAMAEAGKNAKGNQKSSAEFHRKKRGEGIRTRLVTKGEAWQTRNKVLDRQARRPLKLSSREYSPLLLFFLPLLCNWSSGSDG